MSPESPTPREKSPVPTTAPVKDEEAATESDVTVVDWKGPDDPENPLNWPTKRKAPTVVIISIMSLLTPLASSMFAPGITQVMIDFHSTDSMLASFIISIYLLGFAFGPPLVAPLSELYGRLPVYHVCSALFLVFMIACALAKNPGMLIAFRLLAGLAGSCPITIGAGTIADLVKPEKRGGVMAIWAMGPLLGPVVGPIAGGFLTEAKGWAWTFWVLAIFAGVVLIASLAFIRETYPPVLLERQAAKLRKETGNKAIRSALDSGLAPTEVFLRAIVRPMKLLFLSPIVFVLSLYTTIVYGVLYLLFTTFPETFETIYGFSTGVIGLAYLGFGIGFMLGLVAFGVSSDKTVKKLSAGGPSKPEYRLPPLVFSTVAFPIGLFWYGWTAEKHVHWILPIVASSFIGFGLILSFMSVNTYLVDAFTTYSASAIAANTIIRSLGAAFLPLAGSPMFDTLGLGWGCSLLGFLSLFFCPAGLLLYRYGERIRTSPRFQMNL